MSIFKKFVQLFKEDKPEPQVATGFEAYGVDSGGESQPKSRLYLEEMKGWVGACVSAIADEIGTIDIKLYKYTNGDIDEVTEHPMLDLLYNINNFTTKFDHFWVTQSYLELCGESPWFLDRENGKIVGIYFLRPDKFSLITDSTKLIEGYKYDIGNGKSIKLGLDEVIYLKIPNPAKPFRGIGTLEMARVSVDIDNYSEEWNKNFYKNSAHPDSVLKVGVTQMNEQQRGELKKSLRKNYASLKNSHKTMVLFGDMEFEKLSSTQKDMDFLEQQKFSRDKILGIFRVPKAILAQTDGVNYAAAKAAYYIFSRFTIKPKMTRLVAQLNEFLLPMFSGTENMFFSFTSPVPEDEELKIKKHESALKSGWMTINEVRDTEGLAPVDGGDVIYQPMNMIALGTTLSVDETAKKFKYEIVAMKARNKKYFEIEKQIKETKIEMIEKVKSGIKKKLEEGETTVRILEDGEKMKVWEKKEVMFNKYLKRVKDGQEIIFREQRKIVMSKLNKLKSIKATPTNIYKDIKLNTNTEIARTLKIEFPIFEELFKDAGDETFKLLEVEMQMEIDTETRKLLKADTRKFAKAATLTTNESIKTLVTDIIGEGGSMLDLQKGLGTMFTKAEEYRAKRIAETETQRYNNSASEKAFIDSEVVESKEWFANPGACQFCQPLNGKSIGLGKSYFNKGDTASGNDGGSLNLDYDSTEHPPLHPNCFIDSQVPIFTSKGWKHIGRIKVGDLVLTHKKRFRKVTQLIRTPKQLPNVTTLEFNFGILKNGNKNKKKEEKLTLTSNHPVLCNGKWTEAGKIKEGDKLELMANHCQYCGELIPYFSKFCNHSCMGKDITERQWSSEEHRLLMSEKISKDMKKQWRTGKRKEWNLEQLKKARKNIKNFVLNDPEVQKKAHRALGKAKYGKTWIEEKTGWILNENGIEVESQYPVKKKETDSLGRDRYYYADFKVKDTNILIECDGKFWHKNKEKDEQRQKEIEDNGFIVLRFTDDEIKANLQGVADEVKRVMNNHNGKYHSIDVTVQSTKQWIPKKPKMLYNFSVEEDESYIAKGFTVHNCRCILVPVFKPIKKDIKPKKDIKKPNLKEVIIVEVDKTEKEYKLKIKELEDKMKDINKIEGKTKKEEKQVKKEKEKLKELRKEIVKEFNTQQDVK